jgi:hypothetical protein
MAVIRDNRGALLASNLSQYIAGAANTAGTPIDTNELVRIMNQFLGQGEQISSDLTTITNGIYKKFGAIDKVTNRTEVVTSGIWSNDTGSLQLFYTSSTQQADVSGKYYLDVYNLVPSNTSAEVQFSIAYGHISGGAVPTLTQTDSSYVQTRAIYSQYRNILLDSGDQKFSVYFSSSAGLAAGAYDIDHFFALNINRARYKERLDPGNIQIALSGSAGRITLIDDSAQTETVGSFGRVFNMVSGALNIGTANEGTINSYVDNVSRQGYGLFYPDLGIILLNPQALSGSLGGIRASGTPLFVSSSTAGTYNNVTNMTRLYESLVQGADFQARRTENVSTSHYFVRANNREFNFSNNPTFVTGSVGQFVQSTFERDPHVYITSIGLYDDANELLAVAKTSKPIEKSFDKEIAIKVKLDF